ncbi:MAG: hypothetical protein ABSB60_00335 [Terracidiphilus sp.]|jgi:hypothetical protein
MISEGTYTVRHTRTHLQIAEEWFRIGPFATDDFLVESRRLTYGQNASPDRSTRVWVDACWMPNRVEVQSGPMHLEASVGDDETTVRVWEGGQERTANFAVPRNNLFFALPGTLHAPLFATKRFCLEGGTNRTFQVVPAGTCYVERREGNGEQQQLWAQLMLSGQRHTLQIAASREGDLLSYVDVEAELCVELER